MDLATWITRDLRSLETRLSNGVLAHIPTERRTERVDGGGIAPIYVLWHTARHHDLAVNAIIRDGAEVLERWAAPVGLEHDTWRGLAEAEDQALADELDPEAVGAYLVAVIEETASWIERDGVPDLDAAADPAAALDRIGTPTDRFDWLYGMWDDKPVSFFLGWEAIGHGYNHLGELVSIRNRMGLSPF